MHDELLRLSAAMCESYMKEDKMYLVADDYMNILDNLVTVGVISDSDRRKLLQAHADNYNRAMDGKFKDTIKLNCVRKGKKGYIVVLNMDVQKIIDALKMGARTIGYIELE